MTALLQNPRVETERLILRRPVLADADRYVEFHQSDRAKYVEGVLDERESWYCFYTELGHWDLHGFGSFAVTLKGDDRPVGMVGPFFPRMWPEPEIGYIVYPEVEGKGIAFEAAVAARIFAFRSLGWKTAVSYIDPENARSIRLAERMGAKLDPDAVPVDEDDLVYRHPAPGVAS
ncbi:MAG: GNAT family N-acetyltransferase [Pseudomonadota bacterium]